jgi:hypothetical protein
MSGWNPAGGSNQGPYGEPVQGWRPAGGDSAGGPYPPPASPYPPPPSPYPPPASPYPPSAGAVSSPASPPSAPSPASPPPPRRPGSRRSQARLWIGLSGAAAIIVAAVVIAAVIIAHPSSGTPSSRTPGGIPAGTPLGVQLQQLLPPPTALPQGWNLVSEPHGSATFGQAGKLPPQPMNQCLDFDQGFDVGAPGDTFVSSATESADFGAGPGDGFLRADLFAVMPGDTTLAIKAVGTWVARCSSYTVANQYYDIHYTVTAAPVPGLGDQSLDVHVTEYRPSGTGANLLQLTDNNTLLVGVGNDLIAIECLAPANSMINSLAALAAPMVKRLPSASALPTSGPALRPKPTPAASPNLSPNQLNNLLPVSSGLPAAYYQNNPESPIDWPSPGDAPLTSLPGPMSCSDMESLTDEGFIYQFDENYREVATLADTDDNDDSMQVSIDEVTTDALASDDVAALKSTAVGCPQFSVTAGSFTWSYTTAVTSVPGLGAQNVNINLQPAPGNAAAGEPDGPVDLLAVRVGAAVVLVSYNMPQPGPIPPLATIAGSIVDRL